MPSGVLVVSTLIVTSSLLHWRQLHNELMQFFGKAPFVVVGLLGQHTELHTLIIL